MSINSIFGSSQTDPLLSSWQTQNQQQQQYWTQLAQSLQSGNLSAAQQAFAGLQQNNTVSKQAVSTTQTSQATQATQLSTDMKALGTALQSGNLSAAQSAFSKVQQDMQGAQKGHHHHHHHGAPEAMESPDPIQTTAASTSGTGLSITA
jgi:hypothetical protein